MGLSIRFYMGAIPPYQNKKGFFSSFSDSHLGESWKAYSLKGEKKDERD